MRCIFVNGASLKAEVFCAHCRNKIGESYIREIGTKVIYCDYRCYSGRAEAPVMLPMYHGRLLGAGSFNS